jgi:LmbE family N-acetylglucosaminyl deacetylase
VDITEAFESKLAALRCHESQVGHEPDLDARLRAWATNGAKWAGLEDGRLAELFQVVMMPASGSA